MSLCWKLNRTLGFGLLVGFFLLTNACGSVDTNKIRNLHDGEIEIAGHAGLGFANLVNPYNPLPANSMTSLLKALDLGATAIEVDVQITADSVLVLYHDDRLESKSTGTGCISNLQAEEVVGLNYVCGFPFDLMQSEQIISLQQLLDTLKQRTTVPKLFLDLHAFNNCNSENGYLMAEAIAINVAKIVRLNELDPLLVQPISTVPDLLNRIRNHHPDIFLIYEETGDISRGMTNVLENGYPAIAIKPSLLDTNVTNEAHAHGIEVITFGGKSSTGLANMVRQNPDVIQADNVAALIKLLQKKE